MKRALHEVRLVSSYKTIRLLRCNDLSYFVFPGLSGHEHLAHFVFTRCGGVSDPPYDSLNTSYSTGDRPARVRKNLRTVMETAGAQHLVFMNQLHGKDILTLRGNDSAECGQGLHGDAIITDVPLQALMVKQADCQAVILYDPKRHVVSNVHCGWRGNVYNILGAVVGRMTRDFGCRESDLMAAIGPSLGPCCAQFVTHEEIFPEKFRRFMVRKNYFDLWALSRWQLLQAGLQEKNIEVAGLCTCCETGLFYSYRAEGVTGRSATVAMLK